MSGHAFTVEFDKRIVRLDYQNLHNKCVKQCMLIWPSVVLPYNNYILVEFRIHVPLQSVNNIRFLKNFKVGK